MISNQKYLYWQGRLESSKLFRQFWLWWGLYAILCYGIIGAYILVYDRQGWKIVLMAILAGLFNKYVVCEIVHFFCKKAHPYQRLHFKVPTWWLFSWSDDRQDSFPSEHASTTVAISTIFYLFHPVLGLLAYGVAVIISAGRIVIGYHDMADVLFGYFVGLVSGYLIYTLLFFRLFTS